MTTDEFYEQQLKYEAQKIKLESVQNATEILTKWRAQVMRQTVSKGLI